jgi:hypothetical protein
LFFPQSGGGAKSEVTMKALLSLIVAFWAGTFVCAAPMELRGRVVCMTEGNAKPSANHEHVYGFKTSDGKTYQLVRAKLSEALFVDKRLQDKDLLLRGNVSADSQKFEPTAIQSMKDGVVHEVYYWCEICAIEAVAPEICVCCQGPVELIEKPLRK